jgi:CRISPR-associated endoribonuclease cas6
MEEYMLSKIEIKLSSDKEISYNMSSIFHGALMEHIDKDYCNYLHSCELNPYSQYLTKKENVWYWVINTLNSEAYKKIIEECILKLDNIYLSKKNTNIIFSSKYLTTINKKSLIDNFYEKKYDKYVELDFRTTTTFKKNGEYIIYPDIRCIYQSLMRKYDFSSMDQSMFGEETLEHLCEFTKIVQYNLKSSVFHLEGVKIPGFIGKIKLKISGTKTITSFANMLFDFGAYSGIGAKTSLGMGSMMKLERKAFYE